MSDKKNAIGILFEVLGKGSIDGESGALIKKQLEEIAKSLTLKVKVEADEKQLNNIKQITKQSSQNKNVTKDQTSVLKKQADEYKKIETRFSALRAKAAGLNERYSGLTKNSSAAASQMERLMSIANTPLSSNIDEARVQLESLKRITTESATAFSTLTAKGDTAANALKKQFSSSLNTFIANTLIIQTLKRVIMELYQNVIELDSAITNLQVATGNTREETEQLIIKYSELGKTLGATTIEVAEAADTWLRQGYTLAETNELITNTMMLSKLGQMESASAAKALTSAQKGYQVETSDTIRIVDKLTAVDMEAAVSAGEIATAMAETAVSANVAGISMDKLIGYISTVAEVTQDGAESVGTFYKTMFARMGNVAAGADVDAEGESLSNVETVLNSLNISLRDATGDFRNFGEVLDEVAHKWENYTSVQQHQIATAFAGTRQQEKFLVLLENYNAALDYASTSEMSNGTAQEKYTEAYLNSIEAKTNALKASIQSLSNTTLNSGAIKELVDAASSLVGFLDKIAGNTNIINLLIGTLFGKIGSLIATKATPVIINLVDNTQYFIDEIKAAENKWKSFKTAFSQKFSTAGIDKTKQELNELNLEIERAARNRNRNRELLQTQDELLRIDASQLSYIDEQLTELEKKRTELGENISGVTQYAASSPVYWGDGYGDAVAEYAGYVLEYEKLGEDIIALENEKAQVMQLTEEHSRRRIEINNDLSLSENALVDSITKGGKKQEELSGKLKEISNNYTKVSIGISTITSMFSGMENGFSKIIGVVGGAGAVLTSTIPIFKAVKVAGTTSINAILTSLKSLDANVWIAIIQALFQVVMGVIEAVKWFIESDERAKEAAVEAAEAMQEETNALKEVADKAKDAANSITSLTDAVRELSSSKLDASSWYNELGKIGTEVANLLGDESLSTADALNKLLGGNYSISDFISWDRKDLLDKIDSASLKESQKKQLDAYKSQSDASFSSIKADAMKETIDVGSGQREYIREFKELFDAEKFETEGINYYDHGGKKIDLSIDAQDSQEYLDRAKGVVNAYKEKYKNNLSALNNNAIYKYFNEIVTTAEGYIQKKDSALSAYASTTAQIVGDSIAKSIDTKNVDSYEEFKNSIVESLEKDETIANELDASELGQLAEDYIARNYADLFNKYYGKTNIILKDATAIFEEIEGAYDSLNDSLKEMSENGIVSADSIKELKEEYPELISYLEEAGLLLKDADGYKMQSDALDGYADHIKDNYITDIVNARGALGKALDNFNDDKTDENYEKLLYQKEQLENAIENYNNFKSSEAMYIRSSAIEEYTKALEEQKETYKELCDIRKDLLKTYQDELNKQKQLTTKQNNVSTLKTQLSLAKLDTSAAGQAKARQLQSSLEKAEEELEEYTLELAIEDITNEIENASSEYERLIDENIKDIVNSSTESIVGAINGLGVSFSAGSGLSDDDARIISEAISAANNKLPEYSSNNDDEQPSSYVPKTSGNASIKGKNGYTIWDDAHDIKNAKDVTFRVDDGDDKYYVKTGEAASYTNQQLLNKEAPNAAHKDIVALNEKLYVKTSDGTWREIVARTLAGTEDDLGKLTLLYMNKLNALETHHAGGFAGWSTSLKSNEVFAKLLQGEFVSTPKQMDTFIKKTLPSIATANGSTIQYNAPIFEIQCGDIDKSTLPDLETIINSAVAKMEKNMKSALSRTGYRR